LRNTIEAIACRASHDVTWASFPHNSISQICPGHLQVMIHEPHQATSRPLTE
jgi:hypothetical protein